jgi:hypothetical protein
MDLSLSLLLGVRSKGGFSSFLLFLPDISLSFYIFVVILYLMEDQSHHILGFITYNLILY